MVDKKRQVNKIDRAEWEALFDKRVALGCAEVASALGITLNALYLKVHRRQVPYHRLGRSIRFTKEDFAALLKTEGATNVS